MNGNGSDIKAWPIAALRIYTGIFFLYYGIRKIAGGDFNVTGFLNSQLDNSFAFYKPLIESVVLPNAGLFSFFVAWGEVALGIALIVGFATRYAALAGAFMVANFWFAQGAAFLDAQNQDAVWFVILLVLSFVPAGRVLGLDQRLSDRYPFLG